MQGPTGAWVSVCRCTRLCRRVHVPSCACVPRSVQVPRCARACVSQARKCPRVRLRVVEGSGVAYLRREDVGDGLGPAPRGRP